MTVTGNTITVTGVAGNNPWALVSGMELQDTYASVTYNTVTVNNLGENIKYCQAYGISYCQSTAGFHQFDIYYNHVTVNNGPTAVYILSGSIGNINVNWLTATQGNFHGNNAIYAPTMTIGYNFSNG